MTAHNSAAEGNVWSPGEPLRPAQVPTMYFFGVTTHGSSIMRIFPVWIDLLELGPAVLRGMNFRVHDKPAHYRQALEFLRDDRLSLGALVTTHKLDLVAAAGDLFDELDPHAQRMREVSSIAKRDGRLIGHAKDAQTGRLALTSIVGDDYWRQTGAEFLMCGAGGAALAMSWHLLNDLSDENAPRRLVITDVDPARLDSLRRFHASLERRAPIAVEYHHVEKPQQTDRLISQLAPYSVIVNATGLGKDAPGSPISDAVCWPAHAIVWDFNYRGDLQFLEQARRAPGAAERRVLDGWEYFLHGWLQVMADVFDRPLPTEGPLFERLARVAAAYR